MKTSVAPASGAEVDGSALVRAASRGFTVLLLGGVVQPWVIRAAPVLGYWWLVIVAAAAFVLAAASAVRRASVARLHLAQGALAALGSYLLIVPIVLHIAGFVPWVQVASTSLMALVVGFATQIVLQRGHPQRRTQLPPAVEASHSPAGRASRGRMGDVHHKRGRDNPPTAKEVP